MSTATGQLSLRKQSPPDLVALFECAWRHKWTALASGVAMAGLFATIAYLAVPARYKATTLIRLSAPNGIVERPNESSAAEREFRSTQGELIRMPHVLTRAVESPGIKDLGEVKSDPEGLDEVGSWLQVELPKSSEIMRITVEHDRAAIAFLMANAITDAYLMEVRRGSEEENRRKTAVLEKLQSDMEDRLAKSWTDLQTTAKQLGASDPASASLQAVAEIENYRDYARRLRDVQSEKREAERQVRMIKNSPDEMNKEMPEDASMHSVKYAMFQAKLKREKALSKWGPNHPQVSAAEMEENALAKYYQKTSAEEMAKPRSRQEELLAEPLATIARLNNEEQALQAGMREIEEHREILGGDNVAKLEVIRNAIARLERMGDRLWQTHETLEVESHADQRVQLISYATLPQLRDSSKRDKLTLAMAAGGFGLAFLLIAAAEYATGRLHSQRDFLRRTDLELLGYLPTLPKRIALAQNVDDGDYRRLQTNLDMLAGVLTNHPRIPDARVFMVTSAREENERAGVAMHFSAALARMGKKTVLVNLDLRDEPQTKYFDRESDIGVAGLVHGLDEYEPESEGSESVALPDSIPSNRSLTAVATVHARDRQLIAGNGHDRVNLDDVDLETGIANLSYLPTGSKSAEPLPILTDLRLRELVDELKRDYTYIVLDVAAAARFPDAVHLAWMADAAVLSVQRNKSEANSVLEARERLSASGLPVFGLMLA